LTGKPAVLAKDVQALARKRRTLLGSANPC
jgi:hypothetical protein